MNESRETEINHIAKVQPDSACSFCVSLFCFNSFDWFILLRLIPLNPILHTRMWVSERQRLEAADWDVGERLTGMQNVSTWCLCYAAEILGLVKAHFLRLWFSMRSVAADTLLIASADSWSSWTHNLGFVSFSVWASDTGESVLFRDLPLQFTKRHFFIM